MKVQNVSGNSRELKRLVFESLQSVNTGNTKKAVISQIVEILLSEISNGRAFEIFRFMTSLRPVLHLQTLQNNKWNRTSLNPKSRHLFKNCLDLQKFSCESKNMGNVQGSKYDRNFHDMEKLGTQSLGQF